jgi:hypothetical protein
VIISVGLFPNVGLTGCCFQQTDALFVERVYAYRAW